MWIDLCNTNISINRQIARLSKYQLFILISFGFLVLKNKLFSINTTNIQFFNISKKYKNGKLTKKAINLEVPQLK